MPYVLIVLPVIIVQPFRFEIVEEFGCSDTEFNYVTYIYYMPQAMPSLACVILARESSFHHGDLAN